MVHLWVGIGLCPILVTYELGEMIQLTALGLSFLICNMRKLRGLMKFIFIRRVQQCL